MATNSTGAVFFLGSRAHYQVLEQPNNYDAENGNTSTETIYQNQSVEELWPKEQTNKHKLDANYNLESQWTCADQNTTVVHDKQSTVKRRVKRRSSEALLCEMKPAVLNDVTKKEEEAKPNRNSFISYITSIAHRRKCRLETDRIQYLKHIESALNSCTYRESCRCLDCQSRYFECGEESDEYNSENDYSPYSVRDVDSPALPSELDDEVFLDSQIENDNASTDLLLEEEPAPEEPSVEEEGEEDKQLQMEVAASTSAMFNILLYHPFSCVLQ